MNSKMFVVWVVLIAVISFSAAVSAATYGGGSGTLADPYQIWTAEQMNTIGQNPADWDDHFRLMDNISMAAYTGTQYNIIGNNTTKFTGSFDGNYHTISNLSYTASGYVNEVGLFGYTWQATIKNLGIVNAAIYPISSYAGVLVGRQTRGTISNCYSTGEISSAVFHATWFNVSNTTYTGGLVGLQYEGAISNSYSNCSVTTSHRYYDTSSKSIYTGGLVGQSNGTITGCYSTGNVSGSFETSYWCLVYCHVGGLIGSSSATLTNCCSSGSVNGLRILGAENASEHYLGGLAGTRSWGSITNCFSTGYVSSTGNHTGGLLAYSSDSGGTVSACFWGTQTSNQNSSAGGSGAVGHTTALMQTQATFTDAGWDFSGCDGDAPDWRMQAETYPTLTAQAAPVAVPSVAGLSQAAAIAEISAAELVHCTATTQYSDIVPAGQVISQTPAAGTMVTVGSGVDLVVSLGAAIAVPDVVGLTQQDAAANLFIARLTVGDINEEYSDTAPVGTVISQWPAAGTQVEAGTAVVLVVSLGQEPLGQLPLPEKQRAFAGNSSVRLVWLEISDLENIFDHYAIYRDSASFDSVAEMTPIATISDISTLEYIDTTVNNDQPYYYAVTAVTGDGGEVKTVAAIGPRTPRDETDVQVVSIARTPFYPRYCVDYTGWQVTEPSGFGPYWTSAATGFCDGQDETTKHWPDIDEPMTYTATVRNRGTNTVNESVTIRWEMDNTLYQETTFTLTLLPGQTATYSWAYQLPWDNEPHDIRFTLDINDSRPDNNTLTRNTLSVGFLTYIDASFIEKFRQEWSGNWPNNTTDDAIDWLNRHAARFNELFADAGCEKRVHYDVLQVLDDLDETPIDPATIHFAIFPLRYRWDLDGDPRQVSAYYNTDHDIDYGLLHEMGHQLGMIDIYQLNVSSAQNLVNGLPYAAHNDLMNACSPFIAAFHARAMNHWLRQPHGYYGQFLYNLPQTMQLRLLDYHGRPMDGATVKMYQMCEKDGLGRVIPNDIKAQGTTDPDGLFTLPNVPIDSELVPPTAIGDTLHDNPFGYVHVVGTNGLLLFAVEYDGRTEYCWLDITEACLAYWDGQTETAVFERQLPLGAPTLQIMPKDLAEATAYDWTVWADGATASVEDDAAQKHTGAAAVKFTTNGGFDTYLRYPKNYIGQWDLSDATQLHLWFYAENDTGYGFQGGSPWIRLKDALGNYIEYAYYENGERVEFLNSANYAWQEAIIPLDAPFADTGWNRTEVHGVPNLNNIQYIEIHADTWEYGFKLWIDDVRFDWPEYKYCDFETDGTIDIADLMVLAGQWLQTAVEFAPARGADLTQDKTVDMADFALLAECWLEPQ